MKTRIFFTRVSSGALALGMALCVPAAMQAQDTGTPPAPPSAGMDQQAGPGSQAMHRHGPPSPEHQLRRLTKMLNLTPDQQKQMLPILQDQHKRMESLRSDQNLAPQQRRAQMRDAMMETHQKLEALLTDTQKQQFEQMMQQRRDHMRNRGMGMGPGAGTPPPPPNGDNAPAPPPQ